MGGGLEGDADPVVVEVALAELAAHVEVGGDDVGEGQVEGLAQLGHGHEIADKGAGEAERAGAEEGDLDAGGGDGRRGGRWGEGTAGARGERGEGDGSVDGGAGEGEGAGAEGGFVVGGGG